MSVVGNLEVAPRDRVGKGGARAARRSGLVPGVIYGDRQPPIPVAFDPRLLAAEMHRPGFMTRLVELELDGAKLRCLCRGVQRDPVSDRPIHVDFMRVGAESRVHVRVPVHFTGHENSPGLKRGGVLNVVNHEVEVICAAAAIPEHLEVNLQGLEIGHSVHFEALALPAGVSIVATRGHSTRTVATIVAPTVQAAEAAPAPGAGEAAPAGGDKAEG